MSMRSAATVIALNAMMLMPVMAAEKAGCEEVKIADVGWTDIALNNATAEFILETLGYEVQQSLLSVNVTFEALKNDQMDVFLGNWRPTQDADFKAYFEEGSVIPVATNLTGAKFTLAVPKYVSDAGLKSFDDLQKFAEKLDHKIYGIEPGTNMPLLGMIEKRSHGLDNDWEVIESSEAGMLQQVKRAVQNKEWIVFLGWQPHPMNVDLDMTYLSGGDDVFGPNFGGATVRTIVRKGYSEECGNLTKFFSNFTFDVASVNTGMGLIINGGAEPLAAAKQMMKEHPDTLEVWLQDVT